MKELNMFDLNQSIKQNKINVDRKILQQKSSQRLIRTRPRDPDEVEILNKLCVLKWEKALASGKVVILSKQEWYYEVD